MMKITTGRRARLVLVAMAVFIALLAGVIFIPTTSHGEALGGVIFNSPFDTAKPPVNIEESFPWARHDHSGGPGGGYDRAYTESISKSLNGIATPDHVVFSNAASGKIEPGLNDSVTFYGYGVQPYMDYIFADIGPTSGISFTMRPLWMCSCARA